PPSPAPTSPTKPSTSPAPSTSPDTPTSSAPYGPSTTPPPATSPTTSTASSPTTAAHHPTPATPRTPCTTPPAHSATSTQTNPPSGQRTPTPGALFKTPRDREEEKRAGGIECVMVSGVRTAIVGVEHLPVLEVGYEPFDRCAKRRDLGVVFLVGQG